jgi:glutaredoxin-like protein NrdH
MEAKTMLETLAYVTVDGSRADHEVTVFALSTCGFCKRALAFLNENGQAYRYVYLDQLPLETKTEVKRILKERYNADVAFPFATIDSSSCLVGFIEPDWRRVLGI